MTTVHEFDLLPFIETSDGTPSFPISMVSLCLITAITWHWIYTQSMKTFPEKKKAARIAPLVHAIWATLTSLYVMYHHIHFWETPSSICNILGPTQYIFTVSLGYFVWDLFICFKENWGIDYKIHAIFCVLMYGIAVTTHTMHRWGILVLFYEFSTIFLHCYIFLYYYGYKWIGDYVKVLFGLSFFFCRLIVGSFVTKECIESYLGWKEINHGCIGSAILTFVLIVNLMFHVLNLHWFGKIVSALWGKPDKKTKVRKTRRTKSSSKTATSSSKSTKHKNGTSTKKEKTIDK